MLSVEAQKVLYEAFANRNPIEIFQNLFVPPGRERRRSFTIFFFDSKCDINVNEAVDQVRSACCCMGRYSYVCTSRIPTRTRTLGMHRIGFARREPLIFQNHLFATRCHVSLVSYLPIYTQVIAYLLLVHVRVYEYAFMALIRRIPSRSPSPATHCGIIRRAYTLSILLRISKVLFVLCILGRLGRHFTHRYVYEKEMFTPFVETKCNHCRLTKLYAKVFSVCPIVISHQSPLIVITLAANKFHSPRKK